MQPDFDLLFHGGSELHFVSHQRFPRLSYSRIGYSVQEPNLFYSALAYVEMVTWFEWQRTGLAKAPREKERSDGFVVVDLHNFVSRNLAACTLTSSFDSHSRKSTLRSVFYRRFSRIPVSRRSAPSPSGPVKLYDRMLYSQTEIDASLVYTATSCFNWPRERLPCSFGCV